MNNITINKADLVALISKKSELTKKDSELALNALMASIEESLLAGKKVQLVGFGSFERKDRAARQGRNPRNPEEIIDIPPSKGVVFKAGKKLKDAINA